MRLIDWIWHIRGSVALAPGQSSDDAFGKLEPLFRQPNTSFERSNDTLVFQKKDQAAQDKMSIFDDGTLRIERGTSGAVLRYHLTSRALLACFLAPLLFLGIAQFTVMLGQHQAKTEHASDKSADAKKDKDKKIVPLNPIDKFLGAPAPEKPDKKDADKGGKRDKKPSPTPAYVFAAIFAALYVGGRILEDRLIKSHFTRRLRGSRSTMTREPALPPVGGRAA